MAEFDVNLLSTQGTEYTYMLTLSGTSPNPIIDIAPALKNVVSVEVVQARIPMSEYTIEDDRDRIWIRVGGASVFTDYELVLPSKDYSPVTIAGMINILLDQQEIRLTMTELDGYGKFVITGFVQFTILSATTAWYALGLYDTINSSSSVVNDGSGNPVTDADGNDLHTLEFPNRYDLIVSDVILLNCQELDTIINRGRNSSNFLGLAEFFLQAPGMTEQYYQITTPYRYFSPISSIDKLSLRFSRESEQMGLVNRMNYNFRGIKWYIKLAIKTKEFSSIPPTIDSAPSTTPAPTKGKAKASASKKKSAATKFTVSSMGSGMSSSRSYEFIPMASNTSEYTDDLEQLS